MSESGSAPGMPMPRADDPSGETPAAPTDARDFFISYNRQDRAWAEWIAWQLESAGYTLFLQAWDFGPASNFVLEMHRSLAASRRVVAVLSPSFLASDFTAPEWAAVFALDPAAKERRIVPVRVRPCEPTGLLRGLVYIDLAGAASVESGRDLLLAGVKGLDEPRAGRPRTEPGMPARAPGDAAAPAATGGAPEPPWPPAVEVVVHAAGSVLGVLARWCAIAAAAALALWLLFAWQLPGFMDAQPLVGRVSALLLGALVACGAELLWRGLRRLRPGRGAP